MDNNCHYYFNDLKVVNNTELCNNTWDAINKLAADLNWYDLYRRTYPDGALLKGENRVGVSIVAGEKKEYKRGVTMSEYTPWLKHLVKDNEVTIGNFASDYLNREDVREALHIPKDI